MATTLKAFRAENPDYDDMSDAELAAALHAKFYSDMPRAQFDKELGLTPPAPKAKPAAPKAAGPPRAAPKPAPKAAPAKPKVEFSNKVDSRPVTAASIKKTVGKREPYVPKKNSLGELIVGPRANPKPSGAGVAVRGVRDSGGALAGGTAGAYTGAALGGLTGPAAVVASPVGAVVGGLIGAGLGAYGQHKAEQALLSPKDKQRMDAQRAADEKAHPYIRFAAQNLPGFLMGRPGGAIRGMLANAGLSGGLEGVLEYMTTGKVDKKKVAIAAGMGAAQNKTTRLGQKVYGTQDTVLESKLRKEKPAPAPARQKDRDLATAGKMAAPVDVLPTTFTKTWAPVAAGKSQKAAELQAKYADDALEQLPGRAAAKVERIAPAASNRTPTKALAEADEAVAATAITPPDINSGGRRAYDVLNDELDELADITKSKYETARQTGDAKLAGSKRTQARTARGVQLAVNKTFRDARMDLEHTEAADVARVLKNIPKARTADDLLNLREQLAWEVTNASNDARRKFAQTARRALDDQIDVLMNDGKFAGTPDIINAYREAWAARRHQAQRMQDDGLIEGLTTRGPDGTKLDPAYASTKIFGSGVPRQSATTVRDVKAVRDRLLERDPSAWDALREEAIGRVLGKDMGTPKAGAALAKWERDNPDLAGLFVTQADRDAVTAAQAAVAGAERTKAGVELGGSYAKTDPNDFKAGLDALAGDTAALRDAKVAARQELRDAIASPRTGRAKLQELVENPAAQQNLRALLGPEADNLIHTARTLTENVKDLNQSLRGAKGEPPDNAEGVLDSASRAAAYATAQAMGVRLLAPFLDFMRGLGMSAKQAEEMARDLTDPAKTEATLKFIEKNYGQNAAQRAVSALRGRHTDNLRGGARLGVQANAGFQDNAERGDTMPEGETPEEVLSGETPEAPEGSAAGLELGEGAAVDPATPREAYLAAMGLAEGTGKNPNSSAQGEFQFIDKTFAQYARRNFPEATKGMSVDEISKAFRGTMLEDGRTIEQLFAEQFTEDNAEMIESLGFEPTPTALYLAHFLGPKGFEWVATADAGRKLADIPGLAQALAANAAVKYAGKTIKDFTVQDLFGWSADLMGRKLATLG